MSDKKEYKNPSLAADAIVIRDNKILLIERKNAPFGWAFPGGFVDEGESTEAAAIRELKEETGLTGGTPILLHVASEPDRDPRQHVVSIIYLMIGAEGEPVAADDAKNFGWFDLRDLPEMAFDHKEIVENKIGDFAL